MQTFMPLSSFEESARVLDRKRLGGQRQEGVQLSRAVDPYCRVGTPELIARRDASLLAGELPKQGWKNHAAAKMWTGRLPALLHYLRVIDTEWIRRGYKSNLVIPDAGPVVMPSWMGMPELHASHRSALLRKLPEHYSLFGWDEPPDLEYVWPGPCKNLETLETVTP